MDCCSKRKAKVSPARTPPPAPPSSPKHLKGNSSRNLKLAIEDYRISHPNTLIIDTPRFGLNKTQVEYINDG